MLGVGIAAIAFLLVTVPVFKIGVAYTDSTTMTTIAATTMTIITTTTMTFITMTMTMTTMTVITTMTTETTIEGIKQL